VPDPARYTYADHQIQMADEMRATTPVLLQMHVRAAQRTTTLVMTVSGRCMVPWT
jgi:hypothetical protein